MPVLVYPDVRAAVAFLEQAFGFHERVRIGEDHRSQMGYGADGSLIVADVSGHRVAPRPGVESQRVMVRVEDARAHCTHARAHGARILMEPTDFGYGERQYSAEDPAGHRWTFSQTLADVAPEEWGGRSVAPTPRRSARLAALDPLAGEWAVEATLGGAVMARGRASFEWIESGAFLVGRADAEVVPEWQARTPFPTTALIAVDDHSGAFTHAYADARGVSRVYAMTLDGDRWELAGRPGADFHQRFRATVGPQAIDGRWERSADGRTWDVDFDLRYARVA